jgi:hypothetical protein
MHIKSINHSTVAYVLSNAPKEGEELWNRGYTAFSNQWLSARAMVDVRV